MKVLDFFRRTTGKRRAPSRLRGFAAAAATRLLNGWTTSTETPDTAIRSGLTALQARARDSYLNNPFMRRFVGLVRSNVVGPVGVKMQARTIGPDGKPDEKANKALEAAWKDWGRPETCDLTQRRGWVDLQRQAITSAAVDGEILARGVSGLEAGKYNFSIQMLDPALLDPNHNSDLRGGNYIRMGIEYDRLGRRVAYHLRAYDTSTGGYLADNGKRYQSIPAREIIHTFTDDQVGQTRGYPWAAPVLDMLKMVDAYFEAAVTAARGGASKMGFITTADGSSYVGDGKDDEGATISEFEPGLLEQLAEGQSFTAFDPRYPHEMFADFVKSCLQQISAGLNVAYTGLSNNLEGVSFSSIRTGVLEEREHWKSLQNWFNEGFMRQVYEMWLPNALLAGVVIVEGRPLRISAEDKYRAVSFQSRRWSWVDPLKDINTHAKGIETGISTVSEAIRERGNDPDEVFAERATELEKMGADEGTPDTETNMAEPAETADETLKSQMDAYGVGVRSGAISPQIDDEAHFRTAAGLPDLSADARAEWMKENNVRRPITLVPLPGSAVPAGGAPADTETGAGEDADSQ